MIPDQVVQTTLEDLSKISGADLAVYTADGKRAAAAGSPVKVARTDIVGFIDSANDSEEISGVDLFKVSDEGKLVYVLAVKGTDDTLFGPMAVYQLSYLIGVHQEKFDKDQFIKNLLLDNLLLVDIYNRARKLHIAPDATRLVYILEAPPEQETATVENMRSCPEISGNDFVTAVDEKNIILVRQMEEDDDNASAERFANSLLKSMGLDDREQVHLAYGTIVKELKDVSRSYKEARMALDVGKIFFDSRTVMAYEALGIGRLIYQLPIPLCKMFIKEIFAHKSPDDFDDETLTTINKFFENNLNVSETSRQLFIHRNTLVYRLDKLLKSTGLDLRVFEDAITFKIALMVVKYMKYMETLDY